MGGGFSLLWCYFFLPFFSVLARCVVLQRQHLEVHVHVLLCHVCRLSARVRGFFFMPTSLRHVFNTILQCRLTSEGMSTLKRRLLSSFIISYFFSIFFFSLLGNTIVFVVHIAVVLTSFTPFSSFSFYSTQFTRTHSCLYTPILFFFLLLLIFITLLPLFFFVCVFCFPYIKKEK